MIVRNPWTTGVAPYFGASTLGAIARSPWTTETGPYYGAAGLGQVTTDPQALYRELHATAIALNQAGQRLEVATTAEAKQAEMANVVNLREHFQQIRARFLSASAAQDPDAVTKTDRVILAAGDVLAAVPDAIKTLLNTTADVIAYTGAKTIQALLPFGLLVIGVVYLLLFAEKSRIVRRFV